MESKRKIAFLRSLLTRRFAKRSAGPELTYVYEVTAAEEEEAMQLWLEHCDVLTESPYGSH